MLKKIIISLSILMIFTTPIFADVVAKDLGDGQAEITFTYLDDESSEMNVIGSFNSWIEPGDAMIKNAEGLWEYKLVTFADEEIIYKFFNDGNYIFDENAPAEKDDGFAGMNGLIIVSDLLLTQTVPVEGIGENTEVTMVKARQKVTFGTTTYIESDTAYNTSDDKFEAVDSRINAKSLWTFDGDLVKGMPGYMELTFFEGSTPIWSDEDLKLNDGVENMASGFIFNPAYYLGGGTRPIVDKFQFGFDGESLSYQTGYGSAKLPVHSSVIWEVVEDDSVEAGNGYSAFTSSIDITNLGMNLNTGIVPNTSNVSSNYSLYTYLDATLGPLKAEILYEMKSGTNSDFQKVFEDIPRQNIIFGVGYEQNSISLKTQIINSSYTSGGSAMNLDANERVAYEVQADYVIENSFGVNLGYKIRGKAAQMLYGNNDDILGLEDTQTIDLGGYINIGSMTPRLDTSAILADEDALENNIELSFIPGISFDLSESIGTTLTGDFYVDFGLNTDPKDIQETTTDAGLSITFNKTTIKYGLDGSDYDALYNTLLVQTELIDGLTAEIAMGLRSEKDSDYPIGISLGAAWTIPSLNAHYPQLYANFAYNIDPIETGEAYTEIDDEILDNNGEGTAAIRIGFVISY